MHHFSFNYGINCSIYCNCNFNITCNSNSNRQLNSICNNNWSSNLYLILNFSWKTCFFILNSLLSKKVGLRKSGQTKKLLNLKVPKNSSLDIFLLRSWFIGKKEKRDFYQLKLLCLVVVQKLSSLSAKKSHLKLMHCLPHSSASYTPSSPLSFLTHTHPQDTRTQRGTHTWTNCPSPLFTVFFISLASPFWSLNNFAL